jgi:hypothetical protein
MAKEVKTWDLEQLAATFLGVPVEGGFGEGEILKGEFDEADFTIKKGADGGVVRSKTYNGVVEFTLTLMQTSMYNALFSALRQADVKGKNGAGIGPSAIKDLNGATLYFASRTWIKGPPNPTFGREATHRDWVFVFANCESFEGGN